jgi:hypothetical protein
LVAQQLEFDHLSLLVGLWASFVRDAPYFVIVACIAPLSEWKNASALALRSPDSRCQVFLG